MTDEEMRSSNEDSLDNTLPSKRPHDVISSPGSGLVSAPFNAESQSRKHRFPLELPSGTIRAFVQAPDAPGSAKPAIKIETKSDIVKSIEARPSGPELHTVYTCSICSNYMNQKLSHTRQHVRKAHQRIVDWKEFIVEQMLSFDEIQTLKTRREQNIMERRLQLLHQGRAAQLSASNATDALSDAESSYSSSDNEVDTTAQSQSTSPMKSDQLSTYVCQECNTYCTRKQSHMTRHLLGTHQKQGSVQAFFRKVKMSEEQLKSMKAEHASKKHHHHSDSESSDDLTLVQSVLLCNICETYCTNLRHNMLRHIKVAHNISDNCESHYRQSNLSAAEIRELQQKHSLKSALLRQQKMGYVVESDPGCPTGQDASIALSSGSNGKMRMWVCRLCETMCTPSRAGMVRHLLLVHDINRDVETHFKIDELTSAEIAHLKQLHAPKWIQSRIKSTRLKTVRSSTMSESDVDDSGTESEHELVSSITPVSTVLDNKPKAPATDFPALQPGFVRSYVCLLCENFQTSDHTSAGQHIVDHHHLTVLSRADIKPLFQGRRAAHTVYFDDVIALLDSNPSDDIIIQSGPKRSKLNSPAIKPGAVDTMLSFKSGFASMSPRSESLVSSLCMLSDLDSTGMSVETLKRIVRVLSPLNYFNAMFGSMLCILYHTGGIAKLLPKDRTDYRLKVSDIRVTTNSSDNTAKLLGLATPGLRVTISAAADSEICAVKWTESFIKLRASIQAATGVFFCLPNLSDYDQSMFFKDLAAVCAHIGDPNASHYDINAFKNPKLQAAVTDIGQEKAHV
jgi:hypothetical protein